MTPRRSASDHAERGFTLVELLVVVVVIAVLAAIAVPVYLAQQRGARDSRVVSDVHATALDVGTWVVRGGSTAAGTADYQAAGGTLTRSDANVIDVTVDASGSYTVCAYAVGGGTYSANTSAYLWTSDSRRGAKTTAGCPGDGVPATVATTAPTGVTPVATASTAPAASGSGTSTATPTPTPTADVWVDCANENGTCSFTGTRSVRYGLAPSTWSVKTLTNGTPCTNAVFGDPAYGYGKQCQYLR